MNNQNRDNDTFLSRIFGLNSVYYNQANGANGIGSSGHGFYDDNSVDLEANFPMDSNSVHLHNLNLLNSEEEPESDNNDDSDSHSLSSAEDDISRLDEDNLVSNDVPPGATSINWNSQSHQIPPEPSADRAIKFNLPKRRSVFKNNKLKFNIPPKERALYLWANIVNMDEFLNDIYYYYQNRGLNNIVLSKLVDLFILAFILWFSVFLKWGINYEFFRSWDQQSEHKIYLNDLIKVHYFSEIPFMVKFLLLGFSAYIVLRLIQLYFNYKYKLKEIQNFYYQLINIRNDDELMTISWSKVVSKIVLLKNYNNLTSSANQIINTNDLNSKVRLNPQDIANRIMRKENYFVALINKDVLDLETSLGPIKLTNSNLLTKTLEWNLKLCIFNFIFNANGQVNSRILKDFNRYQLSLELNKRFKMAAIINLILSPFLVVYFVLLYFFKYFNEYRLNPSSIINLRQFTPYAEWKLREFNELPHFFNKRLRLSYNPSNNYINQFPSNSLLINMMYLINFVSGSFTAILVIYGLLLEDENHNFWSFELTENKSVLFYISIFGTLFAITSNSTDNGSNTTNSRSSSDESTTYYDPEASIKYVSQFTHYLPKHWKGILHTQQVKNEYCELFKLRILIVINEVLSILLTPFLLWFNISNYSGAIIDFFRDYSIHIDGLGYICYFSMFNFEQNDKNMLSKKRTHKRRKNLSDSDLHIAGGGSVIRNDDDNDDDENDFFYQDDKMIKSYMYFLESYEPDKSTKRTSNTKSSKGPSNSFHFNKTLNNRFNNRGNFKPLSKIKMSQTLDPSSSLMNDEFNDLVDNSEISVEKIGKSGVLGMLNQFYKQDINKQ
ncbi:autophagy protein atg9 [Yamadazyma tenuis]|uniref:Autophagy-related protein 9 n=1 Tax=Candida tenuis (strain ATCC 10573 / BCRC 21748 / CBS 615 / JCM 9827 / NBRC 10315 / NRRL Y-1498 / VKM Y-70) TaxID=590646 RepID=G3B8R9_CANTC|nr:APG9-domain-containing protein [Yamadazyma tenuis ATCC 10573]EGV62415.1 APG9-domain-containing protein [Yamadazyma tenuis ATCC 10573]WEJ93691.1 autophagy protein atg9 [Yamadazyma tenuis]